MTAPRQLFAVSNWPTMPVEDPGQDPGALRAWCQDAHAWMRELVGILDYTMLADGAAAGAHAAEHEAGGSDLLEHNKLYDLQGGAADEYYHLTAAQYAGLHSRTHNLLSVDHADTVAAAAVRGDIITAQGASPKWARLAKGAAGYALVAGADEPIWAMLTGASVHGLTAGGVLYGAADGTIGQDAGLTWNATTKLLQVYKETGEAAIKIASGDVNYYTELRNYRQYVSGQPFVTLKGMAGDILLGQYLYGSLRVTALMGGRVGIGTIAPDYQVDVAGDARVSSHLGVGDGSAPAPSMSFWNEWTLGFYRYTTGQIGIAVGGAFMGRLLANQGGGWVQMFDLSDSSTASLYADRWGSGQAAVELVHKDAVYAQVRLTDVSAGSPQLYVMIGASQWYGLNTSGFYPYSEALSPQPSLGLSGKRWLALGILPGAWSPSYEGESRANSTRAVFQDYIGSAVHNRSSVVGTRTSDATGQTTNGLYSGNIATDTLPSGLRKAGKKITIRATGTCSIHGKVAAGQASTWSAELRLGSVGLVAASGSSPSGAGGRNWWAWELLAVLTDRGSNTYEVSAPGATISTRITQAGSPFGSAGYVDSAPSQTRKWRDAVISPGSGDLTIALYAEIDAIPTEVSSITVHALDWGPESVH